MFESYFNVVYLQVCSPVGRSKIKQGMDIGIVGMGAMGKNLALNFHRNQFKVAVYNRTYSKAKSVADELQSERFKAYESVSDFVSSLAKPRVVVLLVQADAVDSVGETMAKCMEEGDIIIDSGNSYYKLTEERKVRFHQEFKVHFYGIGISGGEEGALWGPAIMVGGDEESAKKRLLPLLEKVCADPQVDGTDGKKCISYCGPGGAGHMVKMVHNGCEYGIMQLISEAITFFRSILKFSVDLIADVFALYGRIEGCYLFENVAQVLRKKEDGKPLIDLVKDVAMQKGTGRWTSIEALNLGVCATIIDAGVAARTFSSSKDRFLMHIEDSRDLLKSVFTQGLCKDSIMRSLLAAMLLAFQQSICVIHALSDSMQYNTSIFEALCSWRGGCIIRMNLLTPLADFYKQNANKSVPLMHASFVKEKYINRDIISKLRMMVSYAIRAGIPMPAFSAALTYLDMIQAEVLPTKYIQGMRDNFGAHTYERIDKEGVFHSNWTGE